MGTECMGILHRNINIFYAISHDAVCQIPHGGVKFLCQISHYSPTEA